MAKKTTTYSGRNGAWASSSGIASEGMNQLSSATLGRSQKVRSGANSSKTYATTHTSKDGSQRWVSPSFASKTSVAGKTHLSYTIQKTKPKK